MQFQEFVQELAPILNTIILVIIFFYQKNKNKVLVDRIEQQEKILTETKGIVTQQSTAIESQGKVVDTAIKYSESFSPEKLEKLIRKEVAIEQREERETLEKELKTRIKEKDEKIESLGKISHESIEFAHSLTTDLVSPIMKVLLKLLFVMPKEERTEIVNEMEESSSKDMLISVLEKIEVEVAKFNIKEQKK